MICLFWLYHLSGVTWASWHFILPETRLFILQLAQANNKWSRKLHITRPSTVDRSQPIIEDVAYVSSPLTGLDRYVTFDITLQWRHNGHDGVSNPQPHHCLLIRLFRLRSKTSMLRATGLSVGNSPVTDDFPAQKASNAEKVSIWWRHHDMP